MSPVSVVSEVRDFLRGLRRDLPELFGRPELLGPVDDGGHGPAAPAESRASDPHRVLFTERVRHWSGVMGVAPKRIFLKNQRTRWASCSTKGNLNFNRRLASAPAEVVDYVVIHELAHLVEMNHSARFWAVVERWCPEQKSRRRWLRQNSRLLGQRLPPATAPAAAALPSATVSGRARAVQVMRVSQ